MRKQQSSLYTGADKEGQSFIEGPLPFECSIRPRSEERAKAIEKAFKVDAAPTLKAFEYGLDAQDEEWLKQARGGV